MRQTPGGVSHWHSVAYRRILVAFDVANEPIRPSFDLALAHSLAQHRACLSNS